MNVDDTYSDFKSRYVHVIASSLKEIKKKLKLGGFLINVRITFGCWKERFNLRKLETFFVFEHTSTLRQEHSS